MKSSKAKVSSEPKSSGKSSTSLRAIRPEKAPTESNNAAPAKGLRWPHVLGGLALLLFVSFQLYSPALSAPFVFDDIYLPFLHPDMADKPLRMWANVRPLTMATYYWNYHQVGTDPYWYHWFSVVLHAFNAGLVFLIVRKLLDFVGERPALRDTLAVFGALLFLAHPVQTESVAYVTSRSEVLSLFFFLGAYAIFLYRRATEITWPYVAAIMVMFGAAALSKEHVVVLPALLLLTDFFFNPGLSLSGIRKNWRLYLPIAAGGALAVAAVFRILARSDSAGFGMKEMTWYQYLFTQFRAILHYVQLFLFPVNQNVDHTFPVSRSIIDHGSIAYAAVLIGLGVAAWMYRRKFPLAAFGYFAYLILLAPTSSIVPIQDVFVERRLYLPFLCLVLITIDFVRRWRTSLVTMGTALGVLLVVFSGLTFGRAQLWSSPVELWRDSVSKSPEKSRPHFQLGYALYHDGRCAQALPHFESAAKYDKADYRLLVDWGLAADCASQPDVAVDKLKQAIALENQAHAQSMLGMVYGKNGKFPESLAALAEAERLDPKFVMTYVYRGNVYMASGDANRATDEYRRALALDPNNEAAKASLANVERSRQP
jgi:protein O-mannosyl-transferase